MSTIDSVPVLLHTTDAITHGGVIAALRCRTEIRLVGPNEVGPNEVNTAEHARRVVALVVVERLDDAAEQVFRSLQCRGFAGIVLVTGDLDDPALLDVMSVGVSAVVRRADATPDTLVRLIKATAAGEGALPPDLLGRLLNRMSRLQQNVLKPHGWNLAGMSTRETEVLRLVADGLETKEIAELLCYSPRTVKSILHDITNRFQLRNRTHAVAFALREGLI
jgi:DNA-binding NarL/FixJ family response regulator